MNLPPDLTGFLLLLAMTPGILFSQFENIAFFKALSPGLKLAFQVIASGAAAALLTLLASGAIPPDILTTANNFYVLVLPIVVSILANFATHVVVNKLIKPIGAAQETKAIKQGPQG